MPISFGAIGNAFAEKYISYLKPEFQRAGGTLRNLVQPPDDMNLKAKKAYFTIMASVVANTKGALSRKTLVNPNYAQVELDLKTRYADNILDRDAVARMVQDGSVINATQIQNGTNAVLRACDSEIHRALKTGAADSDSLTIGRVDSQATAMTLQKFVNAQGTLKDKDVSGQLCFVISPKQYNDMMQIEEFASRDYVNEGKWDSDMMQDMGTFYGVKIVVWTGLDIDSSNNRTAFMFSRDAIGFAVSDDLFVFTEYNPEYGAFYNEISVDMGAVVIQPKGIVAVRSREIVGTALTNI